MRVGWAAGAGGSRRGKMAALHARQVARQRSFPTNGKKYRVRYIAATPVALRGTQPSQAIMLVKPSASQAKAAPDPDM